MKDHWLSYWLNRTYTLAFAHKNTLLQFAFQYINIYIKHIFSLSVWIHGFVNSFFKHFCSDGDKLFFTTLFLHPPLSFKSLSHLPIFFSRTLAFPRTHAHNDFNRVIRIHKWNEILSKRISVCETNISINAKRSLSWNSYTKYD